MERGLEGLTLKGTGWGGVGGLFASPVGGPGTFKCHPFHPLVQPQPTVHWIPVELISPDPESGGNCLFLAYDSPRMRVGPCTAGGGRREEEEELQGLEGQGGHGPA